MLQFIQPATCGWKTHCTTCSAFDPESLTKLWNTVEDFTTAARASGAFDARRRHQSIEWMQAMIEEELRHRFFRNPRVKRLLPSIEQQVAAQSLPAATAVHRVMEAYEP